MGCSELQIDLNMHGHLQATQKGFVGMNIYSFWNYPFSSSSADIAATQRALDFMVGW
jgi:beta-glucosidase